MKMTRIKTSFSYLGQVFDAGGVALSNRTLLHQSLLSFTSTFRGTFSFYTSYKTRSCTNLLFMLYKSNVKTKQKKKATLCSVTTFSEETHGGLFSKG